MRPLVLLLACVSLMGGNQEYNKRKALHALAGLGVYFACEQAGYPKTGVALAWGIGIGKEVRDQRNGGSFRSGDVAWTALPATVTFRVRW